MADITREFTKNEGREDSGILELSYEDAASGGAKDVLMVTRQARSVEEAQELIARPVGSAGLYVPSSRTTHLVCSIKNRSGAGITWTKAPYWKGTNDPTIKIPTPDDGFDLSIGDGQAVDKAFGAVMLDGEEQVCVIDCSQIPHGIFPVIEPSKQNIKISLLIRPHSIK